MSLLISCSVSIEFFMGWSKIIKLHIFPIFGQGMCLSTKAWTSLRLENGIPLKDNFSPFESDSNVFNLACKFAMVLSCKLQENVNSLNGESYIPLREVDIEYILFFRSALECLELPIAHKYH